MSTNPVAEYLAARPDEWFTRAQLVEAGLATLVARLDGTLFNSTDRGILRARVRPDGRREYQYVRDPMTREQILALSHAARKPAMSPAQAAQKVVQYRERVKSKRSQVFADQAAALPAPVPGPWGPVFAVLLAQPDAAIPLPVLALAAGRAMRGLQRSIVAYRDQGLLITTGQAPMLVRLNPDSGLIAWAAGTGPAIPLTKREERRAGQIERKAARAARRTARQQAQEDRRMQTPERRRVRVQAQQGTTRARQEAAAQRRADRIAHDEQKRQEKQQATQARQEARREQLRLKREAQEQARAQKLQARADREAALAIQKEETRVRRLQRQAERRAQQRAQGVSVRRVKQALTDAQREARDEEKREARAHAARQRTATIIQADTVAIRAALDAHPAGLSEGQLRDLTGLNRGRLQQSLRALRDQGALRITRQHVADLYQLVRVDLPVVFVTLTPAAEQVAEHLSTRPGDTVPYMAQVLGLPRWEVECALGALRHLGRLEWTAVEHLAVFRLARPQQEVRNAAD